MRGQVNALLISAAYSIPCYQSISFAGTHRISAEGMRSRTATTTTTTQLVGGSWWLRGVWSSVAAD